MFAPPGADPGRRTAVENRILLITKAFCLDQIAGGNLVRVPRIGKKISVISDAAAAPNHG
jgi:hypothetical protein